MSCLPLPLLLALLMLQCAFASLPAPLDLRVESYNFHHVLSWTPGPGTPPGTLYQVSYRVGKTKRLNTTSTSMTLKLEHSTAYQLSVRAFRNQTRSPKSRFISFTPFRDTVIGPPELALAAEDNYIHIHISLPKPDPDSGVEDIFSFYNIKFKVVWKKRHAATESHIYSVTRTLTLEHLERGAEYCVQVHTEITVRTRTQPSAWTCTSTPAEEPNRGPVVFGIVAGLVVLVVVALMTVTLLLHYSGFICKLKESLPPSLLKQLKPQEEKQAPFLLLHSCVWEQAAAMLLAALHLNVLPPLPPAAGHSDWRLHAEPREDHPRLGLHQQGNREAQQRQHDHTTRHRGRHR